MKNKLKKWIIEYEDTNTIIGIIVIILFLAKIFVYDKEYYLPCTGYSMAPYGSMPVIISMLIICVVCILLLLIGIISLREK